MKTTTLVLAALAALLLPATTASAAAEPVPTPEQFSWSPTACTADANGLNPELTVTVRDDYPGPLAITGTLVTPHGQPVVSQLRPGRSALLAPGTAASIALVVQVRGGEGAVATLAMRQSQWIGLCPRARVALPLTGRLPASPGLVKPNPGQGGI